jgi:twitching motility protein PilT
MASGGNGRPADELSIDTYFNSLPELGASDLHVKVGSPIMLRIAGLLRPLDMPPVTPELAHELCFSVLNDEQAKQLEAIGSVDLAHSTAEECRVRINVFYQRGVLSMAARYVNARAPDFEELMLPVATLTNIANFESGLVIVAGTTGSGKSTTLAAMVNHLNATRKCHILTLEDPIEYLFHDDKAIINQREIGIDADSFASALKHAMREDPDIIFMGEMRDAETVATGLTAAETGHLVFGTLHAGTAPQVVGRLLDLFPGNTQTQMRKSLVFNLRAVMCQKLLRCTKKDRKRVPACEIMLCTPPVRKHIDDGDDDKIYDVIRKSPHDGMIDFTHSLYELVGKQLVTKHEALMNAPNPNALKSLFDGLEIT